MKQHKQWRVVLAARAAPAAGDWVSINGLEPGEEENVYFTFLDGRREKGFTCLEGSHALGQVPSLEELEAGHASDRIPWLHFPDCMEITGVQRLNWCPENWPDKTTLWQLTIESLPSNIEFEKRYLAETGCQYRAETWLGRLKIW